MIRRRETTERVKITMDYKGEDQLEERMCWRLQN